MYNKILSYLEKSITKRPIEYMAKDITEIVEKELVSALSIQTKNMLEIKDKDEDIIKNAATNIYIEAKKLEKENVKLKSQLAACENAFNDRQKLVDNLYKQLSNIKYLDRNEVYNFLNKILSCTNFFDKFEGTKDRETGEYLSEQVLRGHVDKILSLAINKDKIISTMKKYMCELSGDVPIAYADRIADEIINK